ncbi:MAG: hypothetical protein VKJ85_02780 [Prochlorothrix sp.]|nr:hypothetical protein [Prochlorothrix sp.]
MRTITLQIDDRILEKFLWLLSHFSRDEVRILDQSEYISDDEYLRSIPGMVDSIQASRSEPLEQGKSLGELDW